MCPPCACPHGIEQNCQPGHQVRVQAAPCGGCTHTHQRRSYGTYIARRPSGAVPGGLPGVRGGAGRARLQRAAGGLPGGSGQPGGGCGVVRRGRLREQRRRRAGRERRVRRGVARQPAAADGAREGTPKPVCCSCHRPPRSLAAGRPAHNCMRLMECLGAIEDRQQWKRAIMPSLARANAPGTVHARSCAVQLQCLPVPTKRAWCDATACQCSQLLQGLTWAGAARAAAAEHGGEHGCEHRGAARPGSLCGRARPCRGRVGRAPRRQGVRAGLRHAGHHRPQLAGHAGAPPFPWPAPCALHSAPAEAVLGPARGMSDALSARRRQVRRSDPPGRRSVPRLV